MHSRIMYPRGVILSRKTVHYKAPFFHPSQGEFLIRPPYMDTHLFHPLYSVIWHLRIFSHWSEIEIGRYAQTYGRMYLPTGPLGIKSEKFLVFHCGVFYEITASQTRLCKVMEYEEQQCMGLFLLELKRHRGVVGQQYNHKISLTKKEQTA